MNAVSGRPCEIHPVTACADILRAGLMSLVRVDLKCSTLKPSMRFFSKSVRGFERHEVAYAFEQNFLVLRLEIILLAASRLELDASVLNAVHIQQRCMNVITL